MLSNVRASFALVIFTATMVGGCQKASTSPSSVSSPVRHVNDRACGQSDARANYLGLRVGSLVTLGASDSDAVEENWNPAMDGFVGMTSRVTSLAGVDDQGCPGVRVEADAGAFFWRVRDVQAHGLSDQRRCGQSAIAPDYLMIAPGSKVRLHRHSEWTGGANWSPAMDAFVGQETVVTSLQGIDVQGCPGVNVEVDAGSYFWRVRDLEVISE